MRLLLAGAGCRTEDTVLLSRAVLAGGPVRRPDGCGVAEGCWDGQSEQVADAPQVAAGGPDFMEDAVGADNACRGAEHEPKPAASDGLGAQCGPVVDEQVGVGRAGPSLVSEVEIGVQSEASGFGEQDDLVAQVRPSVVDVGELEGADLPRSQGMEGQKGSERGSGRVWRQESLAQHGKVSGQRGALLGGSYADVHPGVSEDHAVGFQCSEDRSESGDGVVAFVAGLGQRGQDLGAGDLAQGLCSLSGPGSQDWDGKAQVDSDGVLGPGRTAWGAPVAVPTDVEPELEFVAHRVGQSLHLPPEPALDRRGAVVFDQTAGVEEFVKHAGRKIRCGQLIDQTREDGCTGGVLQRQQNLQATAGLLAGARTPAVVGGVVGELSGEPFGKNGVRRGGKPCR